MPSRGLSLISSTIRRIASRASGSQRLLVRASRSSVAPIHAWLKNVCSQRTGSQRRQDSVLDFLHRDRQGIRADSALPPAAARQAVRSALHIRAAASAASNQPEKRKTGRAARRRLPPTPRICRICCLADLDRMPGVIRDNSQFWNVGDNPFGLCIEPRNASPIARCHILHEIRRVSCYFAA